MDLRERVLAAVDPHEGSIPWIAPIFRVSTSFIVRRLQRRRAADPIAPEPQRGGRPPARGPGDLKRRAARVREQPDATPEPRKQRGGVEGRLKTRGSALDRLDRTLTKKSVHADRRDRPDGRAKRARSRRDVRTIEPGKLVLVDERGVNTTMTPAHGRAPRGERVVDSAPASWPTFPVIAAWGRDGVRAPSVCPGSTNPALFRAAVEPVWVSALDTGDVVVFDKLKPHLASGVATSIAAAQARLLRLPPYSPDDTPIEEMDATVKHGLRRAKARTKARLDDAGGQVSRLVTPHDSLGWFRHAGLCAMPR